MQRGPGIFSRVRGNVERRGFRLLLDTGFIRTRLSASRSAAVDGRTLHPEFGAMLALDDLTHRSDLTPLDPITARVRVATDVATVNLPARADVAHEDLAISSPAGPLPARLYVPSGLGSPSPGIVYLHGGGWVTGSVATHDGLCRQLAHRSGCRVLSVDYRLAPEHPFPAAVEDALAASRFALAHAEQLGMDPDRIAVAGDSAGGNLSAVVALHTSAERRRPRLQVLIYPALDMTCSTASYVTFADRYFLTRPLVDWFLRHYRGNGSVRDPDLSPLLAAETTDVPALIYTAGFDVLRDEGRAYAERLEKHGTRVMYREFSDAIHGFVCMTAVTPALAATSEIAADIARELG